MRIDNVPNLTAANGTAVYLYELDGNNVSGSSVVGRVVAANTIATQIRHCSDWVVATSNYNYGGNIFVNGSYNYGFVMDNIDFNEIGGSAVNDIHARIGDTVDMPVTTKLGYVFGGWYLDTNFSKFLPVQSGNKLFVDEDLSGTTIYARCIAESAVDTIIVPTDIQQTGDIWCKNLFKFN